MLNQLRQGAKGWVSKALVGLLALSFAVWGIGGFEGYGAGTLATVGDTEVSVQEFAAIYGQAQRVAVQSGQRADPSRILAQLLFGAALDDEASRYGLGVSSDRVATEIAETPVFQDGSGAFDRERFEALLMNSRMTPEDYIADVRRTLVRNQIAESIGAGIGAPKPLVEAIYRLRNEERTVSLFVVDEQSIEAVGEPGETELQAYFDDNKAQFRAPEYREVALLTLSAEAVADPDAVSEEDLQTEYERRRASFEQPERRHVEQIRFDDAAAVEAALEKANGGETFAAIAEASGTSVTDLGLKTQAEFIDQAVAEAAFAADANIAVAVTEAALEPSLIRVTAIEPGAVTPLAEVEDRLRQDLATRLSRQSVNDLYDQVEDERAGGSTLEEVAEKLSLPYRVIDGISEFARAPDGSAITDVPNLPEVLRETFLSDIGVENSPLRAEGDAWVFFDVLGITEARDRTLDEVREEAIAAWKAQATEDRIREFADGLLARLEGGASLASIALEVGKPVQTVEKVQRSSSLPEMTRNAVAQAFAGPEGHVANAEGAGPNRILLHVDRVVSPSFFAEAQDAQTIDTQLSSALRTDLLGIFNAELRENRTVNVNNAVYQQLLAQLAGQHPMQ